MSGALSPSVVGLVEEAGRRMLSPADAMLRFTSSDVELAVTTAGPGFVISESERGGEPQEVMRASGLDDIQRYVVLRVGGDVRARQQMPRISLPWRLGQVAHGFTVLDRGREWFAVVGHDPSRVIEVLSYADGDEAVKFSHVADVPVDDLVASYLDRAGAPALHAFTSEGP